MLVETEYVPPIIYQVGKQVSGFYASLQVGTGNGYHKASDLFRGAINESANPCNDFCKFFRIKNLKRS